MLTMLLLLLAQVEVTAVSERAVVNGKLTDSVRYVIAWKQN